SLIDPMIEVFNGPTLDFSCERRESSTVPTQAFALLNSQFAQDMALAFAVRLEHESGRPDGRIERAFLLAFGRTPDEKERALASRHPAPQTQFPPRTPPPAKPQRRPIVHQITSELTGATFSFLQQEDPSPYEENLHRADVSPETRALADLALVLLNANE